MLLEFVQYFKKINIIIFYNFYIVIFNCFEEYKQKLMLYKTCNYLQQVKAIMTKFKNNIEKSVELIKLIH